MMLCGHLKEWKQGSSEDKGWIWEMAGLLDTDWKVHAHSFLTLWLASGHTWMIRRAVQKKTTTGWGQSEVFGVDMALLVRA